MSELSEAMVREVIEVVKDEIAKALPGIIRKVEARLVEDMRLKTGERT